MNKMLFAQTIRNGRNAKGLTQLELAQLVGLSRYTIQDWEAGRRTPTLELLPKIAQVLDISVNSLMGETDDTIDMSQARYPDFIRVPVYDADTCAGNGWSHDYVDAELLEHMVLPSSEVGPISPDPDKQPFVVSVKGDSMEEAGLPDGANVCVNPAAEVHDGDAALIGRAHV